MKLIYSIVSRGTERYIHKGYMGIVKDKGKFKIIDCNHNETNLTNNNVLEFDSGYDIYNITLSRFELISEIMYEHNKYIINTNILIVGMGNIGFSCLINLLDKGIKNIGIYLNKKKPFIIKAIRTLEHIYKIKIHIILNKISLKYDTYIDATGNSYVLTNIINNANEYSKIILLGTPRKSTCTIDLLTIHRKNLKLIGAHEIRGVSNSYRNFLLVNLLNKNSHKKSYIKQFVNIYTYSKDQLEKILSIKSNIFEVLKYDL